MAKTQFLWFVNNFLSLWPFCCFFNTIYLPSRVPHFCSTAVFLLSLFFFCLFFTLPLNSHFSSPSHFPTSSHFPRLLDYTLCLSPFSNPPSPPPLLLHHPCTQALIFNLRLSTSWVILLHCSVLETLYLRYLYKLVYIYSVHVYIYTYILYMYNFVLCALCMYSKCLLHNKYSKRIYPGIYPGTTRPRAKSTRTRSTWLQFHELLTPLLVGRSR